MAHPMLRRCASPRSSQPASRGEPCHPSRPTGSHRWPATSDHASNGPCSRSGAPRVRPSRALGPTLISVWMVAAWVAQTFRPSSPAPMGLTQNGERVRLGQLGADDTAGQPGLPDSIKSAGPVSVTFDSSRSYLRRVFLEGAALERSSGATCPTMSSAGFRRGTTVPRAGRVQRGGSPGL